MVTLPDVTKANPFVQFFLSLFNYISHLSICSFLPLAINRFSQLYFPKFLEKLFNSAFRIIVFLILYDLIILSYLIIIYILLHISFMEQALIVFVMFLTIILSIFLLIKIHLMKKLAKKSTFEMDVLNDLYRAAMVCLIQSISSLLYLSIVLLYLIASSRVRSPKFFLEASKFWLEIYLIYNHFAAVFYLGLFIVDSCLMLFVLKTYRRGFIVMWNRIVPKSMYVKTTQTQANNILFLKK
jgi:hypothetical protein